MTVVSTIEWIESTELSTAIREGALYYPILGGFHLLAIALFGGMLLTTDLRLLGWAMQRRRVTDLVEQFRRRQPNKPSKPPRLKNPVRSANRMPGTSLPRSRLSWPG